MLSTAQGVAALAAAGTLTGMRIARYVGAFGRKLPPNLARFARIVGPGQGGSKDGLQFFRTAQPMAVIPNETTPVAVVDPVMGYISWLETIERGAQAVVSKTEIENSRVDADAIVGGYLAELGEAAGLTFQYLLDYFLADVCFGNNVPAETGFTGGDGKAFYADDHLIYSGAPDVAANRNDNLLASTDFSAAAFGQAHRQLSLQKDGKGNIIVPGSNILIVHGPMIMDRVSEFVASQYTGLKPFEASNTPSYPRSAGLTVSAYNCPRLTGSLQYYWSIWDMDAMTAPNGSGLTIKVMRLPGVFPSVSTDGRIFYYTNTMRIGIGAGSTTCSVGCQGAS